MFVLYVLVLFFFFEGEAGVGVFVGFAVIIETGPSKDTEIR